MQLPSLLVLLAVGALIGACLAWLFMRARSQVAFERGQSETAVRLATSVERARFLEEQVATQDRENRELGTQAQTLIRQLGESREENARLRTSLDAEIEKSEEKLKVLNGARDALADQFKNLANQIFEEKGSKFVQQNQTSIDQLLKPLGERLKEFQAKVEETYDKESKQRFSLQQEVQRLLELNNKLSQDATNLTNALKGDSKTQGIWGEMVLETILQASGLRKGREYDTQVSMDKEGGGKSQPDVVVRLPDSKHVVIDAKVSLTAYEAYVSAEDEAVRTQELARHVGSVRRHVAELADRNYAELYGLGSLDFVLMFVPIESALTLVAQGDENVFLEAFNKGVMIVSPTTLLISLRTIAGIWRYEYQNRNAQELVRQCAAMYDKFVGFVADLEDVGKKIDQARSSYDGAYSKLKTGKGNLIRQAERVRELGLKPSKLLPQQLTDTATEE